MTILLMQDCCAERAQDTGPELKKRKVGEAEEKVIQENSEGGVRLGKQLCWSGIQLDGRCPHFVTLSGKETSQIRLIMQ